MNEDTGQRRPGGHNRGSRGRGGGDRGHGRGGGDRGRGGGQRGRGGGQRGRGGGHHGRGRGQSVGQSTLFNPQSSNNGSTDQSNEVSRNRPRRPRPLMEQPINQDHLNNNGGSVVNSNWRNQNTRNPGNNRQGGTGNNSDRRPGDWHCKKCNANNFSQRTECFRCHVPKDSNSNDNGGRNASHNKPKNWTCTKCGADNFWKNSACVKCYAPKDTNTNDPGGNRNSGGANNRAGNWTCHKCGGENFSKRSGCFHCGVQKENLSGNLNASPIGDEIRMLKLLEKTYSVSKTLDSERALNVYLSAWKNCKQLSLHQLEILIVSMAKLQNSFHFETPPLVTHCKMAAVSYITYLTKNKSEIDFAQSVLPSVQNIVNFVRRLLPIEWDDSKDIVKKEISEILVETNQIIVISEKEHRKLSEEIMGILEEMEKDWTLNIKKKLSKKTTRNENGNTCRRQAACEISIWQQATVEWLADPKHFQPAYLPKMKAPDDNKSFGVYSNKEEYFDIVCRLWIGLTFFDGNAALNPKCRQQTAGKECGSVLWSLEGQSESRLSCRLCRHPTVVLLCQNRFHKDALCKKCAEKVKASIIGPSGQFASTHIYDCRVKKVDFEGRIHLDKMVSRRPPQQPIHWRSTKRLNLSCLVAIVSLPERDNKLRMSDPIIWAVIEVHDQAKEEFRRRENGELVVSNLQDEKDKMELQQGDPVAVIDCMTFVPEHIPVLKALDELQLSPLPFEEGALLNLSGGNGKKDFIDFDKEFRKLSTRNSNRNYDSDEYSDEYNSDSDQELDSEDNQLSYKMPDADALIEFLFENSKFDPIVHICRDEVLTAQLKKELVELVNETTLDREQLKSFVESLVEPVHLTQGPPGTGKSYLGVVIVRALMKIRSTWMQVCPSIGDPPILVLSYKNHAIDEFLLDLVKAERGGTSLIRIGGSCNEPLLNQYLETNQNVYRNETKKNQNMLIKLHHQKIQHISIKHSLSPLDRWDAVRGLVTLDQEAAKGKAQDSYAAAVYLCNLVVRIQKMESFLSANLNESVVSVDDILNIDAIDDRSRGDAEDDVDISNPYDMMGIWCEMFPQDESTILDIKDKDIETMYKYVIHYMKDRHLPVPELLYRWINGFKPLAKCSIAECYSVVVLNTQKFCDRHLCRFDENGRCPYPRIHDRFLCEEHSCTALDCDAVKLPSPQIYCEDHACFVCVEQKEVARIGEDEPPRNTCVSHKLCTALILGCGTCTNLALSDAPFCADHANPKCTYKDKDGRQCSKYAESRGIVYCAEHKPPPPKPVVEDKKWTGKIQCKGISKKKKKQCGSYAMRGFEYCQDHAKTYVEQQKVETNQAWDISPVLENKEEEKANDASTVNETSTIVEEIQTQPATNETNVEVPTIENKVDKNIVEDEDECFVDAPLPDEKEKINLDDEEEFYDVDDQLQHIRDVHVIEDREKEEQSDDESQVVLEDTIEESGDQPDQLIPVSQWDWELSVEDRWKQARLLENKYSMLLAKFNAKRNEQIEITREEYHNSKVRAKSRVYEGKAVIGGTIVGCIGRLEAIRKVKPFAILVEEASEVLEPLLFACLGEDTKKFEMIGDHLQLKPSIMSKIVFERINRINVSMFERLINAPEIYHVPSNALSIQRRMRKNICDLTREFYDEIVEIEDHETCSKQKVGQKLSYVPNKRSLRNNKPTTNQLRKCKGGGREIPGVLPHVFFWTHKGAQTKADVGLSRVNKEEALRVLKLTEYLLFCGIPKPCIAVLTPYKGQLMLMRKQFIQNNLLDKFNPNESVRMSTVDRFQGDEADIVIISLVIDSKSHTPFVKLCNRMVVLLSRARLGMYIIGNIGYFEDKPDPSIAHWVETIRKLRLPSEPDTDASILNGEDESLHFNGPRLGEELPLCCPLHRENSTIAKSASDLQLNFCDIKCTVALKCSHPCDLDCHFQSLDVHNTKCMQKIKPPPCHVHNVDLTCSDVYININKNSIKQTMLRGSNLKIDEALKYYRCPANVDVQLPCQHTVQMSCADENDIYSEKTNYPECKELAHNPYVYPHCSHELQVLCCVWFEYKKDPTRVTPCKEKVVYTPTCGHMVKVQCYLQKQFVEGKSAFQCKEKLDVVLPRCGHKAKVTCDKSKQLDMWKGESCVPGVVKEGTNYGPTDHICDEVVEFHRKCGHITKLKCQEAFSQAQSPIPCIEKVTITNPECGHPALIACYRKEALQKNGQLVQKKPVMEVKEGDTSMFASPVMNIKCEQSLQFIRKCGHKALMKCCEARSKHVKQCTVIVEVDHPLCMHRVKVPCPLSNFGDWKPWKQTNNESPLQDGILDNKHQPPSVPPNELQNVAYNCTQVISVRLNNCGHTYQSKCGVAMKDIGHESKRKCEEKLKNAVLNCGHMKDFICSEYTSYKKHPETYTCKEEVFLTCWNYQTCKQVLKSTCSRRGEVFKCKEKSDWTCPKNHMFKDLPICEKGQLHDCPDCLLDNIGSFIKYIEESKNEKKGVVLPEIPEVLKKFQPKKVFTKDSMMSFVESQVMVLHELEVWYRYQRPLWRPLFMPTTIHCFRYNFGEFTSPDFKPFMQASTLNGIQVSEWTTNNVEKLILEAHNRKANQVCLLFGVVFCARVFVDPVDYPGKKTKPYQKNNWVQEYRKKQQFSVLQHNRISQWDHLIIWDPYTILATHKVWLTVNDLREISSQMKSMSPPAIRSQVLRPQHIKQTIPDNAVSSVTDGYTEEEETEPTNLGKTSTSVDRPTACWDGFSLGRKEIITENVQKELFDKLQFCIKASGSSAVEQPFDGINYIGNLHKTFKDEIVPEISLLKCLEQQKLEDYDDAARELKEYLGSLRTTNIPPHPLALIAKARQLLHLKESSEIGKKYLNEFADQWPDAVNNWFEDHETKLLEGGTENMADKAVDENNPLTKWEALKSERGVTSEKMDELMKLTGLRKVKLSAFDIFKSALKFSELPEEVQAANPRTFNFCFLGNAGSGKTTVARMLAEILKDSGARSKGTFVETSAQKLKDEGPEKFRELADSAEDGILFIDEAYDLDPKGDFKGKPIVSELLVIAENKRDKLSIILAGYEDDMNEKLFSFNEGIKSRFDMVYFEDFNEGELKTIWEGEVEKRQFKTDERASIVVSKRLAKRAGRKGFGNARAVRKEVEKAINISMGRDDFDKDNMEITIEDVMGESPLKNPKLQAVLDEFDAKIGWDKIKESVQNTLEICKKNYELQLLGKKTLPIMLNRLFLGNPGTGKTTCAALYGRLLKELNILSSGDVVMAAASDFVGSVVGESQRKTNEMLEKARGKVLVIDEAYNLDDKMYGKQVLDTIVEKVQNTESDDIAVLLLGYEKQMREMLRNQNPGLARRFSADYPFMFEDYNQKQLLDILRYVCKREEIILTSKVSEKIINLLEKQKTQPNFGNAGAINNLIKAAQAKASLRPLLKDGKMKLELADIESGENATSPIDADPLAPLDKLYRMEKIKEELIKIRNTFQVAKREGARDMPELGHFVFRGAPGTGKTTVARAMACILFDSGLLPRNHVEETSGLDLTGEYVGQTKKKVQEKLDAAKGGVLFIDEAYELGKGIYGEEALTTVLAAMTDPEYKLVIIIAGYPKDMENMLARNVGLKSRFTRYMDFVDWNSDDCIAFLEKKAAGDNFIMEENAKNVISDGTKELRSYPGWGNARDVIAMWKVILEERANRVVNEPEKQKTVTFEDVDRAVKKMIADRKPKVDQDEIIKNLQKENLLKFEQLKNQRVQDDVQLPIKMETKSKVEERVVIEEIDEEGEEAEEEEKDDDRDPGVPDEVWEELQKAKQKVAEEEEKRKKEFEITRRLQEELEETRKRLLEEEENRIKLLEEEKRAEEEARLVEELRKQLEEERTREKKRKLQQELEERQRKEEELRKKLLEERERQKREAERLRQIELEILRKQKEREDAERKRAEEQRKQQAIQEKLKQISPCPAGFNWNKVGGGWRCSGGSHFVSDKQLNDQFTY